LAAFSLGAAELAEKWVRTKVTGEATAQELSVNVLFPILEEIKRMILTEGHAPDVEAVREIDRHLRLCKNPEKIVGSKAYLAKQAEEERRAEEKRQKKVLEMQKEQGDPFGDEVGDEVGERNLVDNDNEDDD